ncbi:MAG TPA: hypothetical protein VOA41_21370 [Candidatus Dormibacteraeota bacterium]|nr:hypothetical protein [Candidatus Dormibacteraeota bacterium]
MQTPGEKQIAENEMDKKHIDEWRAALLLGMSEEELRRISSLSGIGQLKNNGKLEKRVYTYEELRKICVLSVLQRH